MMYWVQYPGIPNFKRRLGHKGPKDMNRLPSEVVIFDATNAGRASTFREKTLDHWGYVERDKVIEDIRLVLKGEDEFEKRKNLKRVKTIFYWSKSLKSLTNHFHSLPYCCLNYHITF